METYDIFDHNCNHFSNEASLFLTGNSIPSCESVRVPLVEISVHSEILDILELPQKFASSPMGPMLMPMVRQFTQGGMVDPSSLVGCKEISSRIPKLIVRHLTHSLAPLLERSPKLRNWIELDARDKESGSSLKVELLSGSAGALFIRSLTPIQS